MDNQQRIGQLFNVEAERCVISGFLCNDYLFNAVNAQLSEELFTDNENRKAYRILCELSEKGKEIDITEFTKLYMKYGGDITKFLTDTTTSYELTLQRIEMLRDLSYRRKVYQLCTRGLTIATDPLTDREEIAKLLTSINDASTDEHDEVKSFGDVVKELRSDIVERKAGTGERGIMTGLHIFDSRYGLHCGDLIILGGRTSQGKSSLATTIARNMAIMGIPSAYYSLEMGAKQLTARIMAKDVMLSSSRMLYDKVNDGELESFDRQAAILSNLPIYFDDKSKTSFRKICLSIRAMVRKHGIKVAFIDYLQILANSTDANREQLIGDMARDLKRLAVDENICIIALSQLARAKDKQSPEPTLMEIRGSGQIEEACDIAVLVYRPFVYGIERYKDGTLTFGTAQLTIAKGRSIGLAQEVVNFNGDLTYFSDRDEPFTASSAESAPTQVNRRISFEEENLPF